MAGKGRRLWRNPSLLLEFAMRLTFAHKGYHKGGPTTRQPAGTSPHMQNMRSYDALDDRGRGGQRPGFRKWSSTQVGGNSPVVELVQVTVVESV